MSALRFPLILAMILSAQAAGAAERVKVRVGEHPGFGRLVFDWASPVGVRLVETPERALLQFDRPGELDLDQVRRNPPPGVRGVTPDPDPGGLRVVVEIAPGSKLRLLESGSSTVLDILSRDTPLSAPAARRDGSLDAPVPLSEIKPATPAIARANPPGQATSPKSLDQSRAPLSLLRAPARPEAPSPPSPSPPSPSPPSPSPPSPKPAAAKPAAPGPQRGEGKAPEAAPARPVTQAPAPAGTPAKEAAKGPAASAGGRLLVVADQGPAWLEGAAVNLFEGVPQTMNNLRFQWDAETALAVFRRGADLWLVFDRAAPGDFTAGLAELAPELAPIEQYQVAGATLIRFGAPPILVPSVARDGTTWVMELWPRPPRPPVSLEFAFDDAAKPLEVTFAIKRPGRAVRYDDPVSGAAMIVVPALDQGQGLSIGESFPQFQALRSFQGLALEVADDALQVRVASPGVRIAHPAGLVASHGSSLALVKANPRIPSVGPRLFDLAAWRRAGDGDMVEVRQALQAALAGDDVARLPQARLDLARFYFAHGLTAEAAGVLAIAATADPALPIDPETRLMRGAAAFLGGDTAGAARDLFHPSLAGEAEAELWNAAMAGLGFDWDVAARKFADQEHLIEAYPHRVRTRLRLMAAEAELGLRHGDAATRYLEAALRDDASADDRSAIAVLTGYRYLQDEDPAKARELWHSVVRLSQHRPSQTRARLALLDLAVAEQSVSAAQAIEELERLRFAWRGDYIELALLRRLGDLYLSQGAYRDSLRSFRQTTAIVPNARLARDVAERMREVFFEIMTGYASEDIVPLDALALYEEFKELTLPGAKGDRILTRLGERLVEVDLLPRAAEVLTALVKFRLSGEEKADMGARVATIHLHDEDPEQAIAILGLSEEAGLPEEMKRRRAYLRVRALSRLSRFGEALKLIGGDENPEALRLRADILWAQADWPATAIVLTRLVPERPRADRPLSDQESRNVADLAIALTLAGEPARLAALNQAYKDAMAAGPDKETFALLATGGAGDGAAERSIAEKLAEVAKAEDFMTRYRQPDADTSAN